jgi:hypothetical protein
LGAGIEYPTTLYSVMFFQFQIENKEAQARISQPRGPKTYPKTMLGTGAFGLFKNEPAKSC